MSDKKIHPIFLGASAPWTDEEEEEVTQDHVRRDMANYLRGRLRERISYLDNTDLSTEDLMLEIRRQTAECIVDGNMMLGSELFEASWSLLQMENKRT